VSKTTIHLVRHGHVENPGKVLYGRLPGFVLSATGTAQAATLGRWFSDAPLAAVIASPLERAQITAAAIAGPHGLEVRSEERLIEASNVFEGVAGNLVWYLVRHPWRAWALRDLRTPSWGERNVDLVERVHAAVADIRAEFDGRETVLVSHQAPIWVARLAFEQRPLHHSPTRRRCETASVTTLVFEDDHLLEVGYHEPAGALLRGVERGRPGA
jgi:broad specificity phosphatase PhoE